MRKGIVDTTTPPLPTYTTGSAVVFDARVEHKESDGAVLAFALVEGDDTGFVRFQRRVVGGEVEPDEVFGVFDGESELLFQLGRRSGDRTENKLNW